VIELGFKSSTAIVAALLVICGEYIDHVRSCELSLTLQLDNGLVIQSRVIMLDSLVILLTAFSLLSFLKFAHLGRR